MTSKLNPLNPNLSNPNQPNQNINQIEQNFNLLQKKISDLQLPPTSAKILAVSKLQPIEKIRQLYNLGHRDFAENYVQELLEKKQALVDLTEIRWHFIGHLQKNKVKFLIPFVDRIHSVDSLALAQYLDKKNCEIRPQQKQKILLQINLSKENSKGGLDSEELLKNIAEFKKLEYVQICGLMTMPPLVNNDEQNRVYFHELKKLMLSIAKDLPEAVELSMGTSSDYLVAAQEGATWLRLGTILFGERQ